MLNFFVILSLELNLSHISCREIQLKTPNWLFGQRKLDKSSSPRKVVSNECADEESKIESRVEYLLDIDWPSYIGNTNEEEVSQR